jgi:Ni/Fe-hydrogenase subunit HybB-like protein
MARVLAVLLLVFQLLRFLDLAQRGALSTLGEPGSERWFFLLEAGLWIAPMVLLFTRLRTRPGGLYAASVLVIFGFVTNRLNVSVTGLEAGSGVRYVPKWTEIAVTLALIALGFAIFRAAARHLPIFSEDETTGGEGATARSAVTGRAEHATAGPAA